MRHSATMSPRQASRELGVTSRTVSRWVEEGRLKIVFRTVGGHARFDTQEVEALRGKRPESEKECSTPFGDEDSTFTGSPIDTTLVIATSGEPRTRPDYFLMSTIERTRIQAERGAKAQRELALLHDQAVRQWLGIERGDLFAYLWTYRLPSVAAAIGASVTQLRRICEQHDIPTPPRGYWATRAEPAAPPDAGAAGGSEASCAPPSRLPYR
jgi:excisionase family DNA binding protein